MLITAPFRFVWSRPTCGHVQPVCIDEKGHGPCRREEKRKKEREREKEREEEREKEIVKEVLLAHITA